jgi:EmrB/QacA subfamily drug resistance transporter
MTALLTESRRPRVIRESRYAPWLAVASVCLGAFMGQLDASIVTLAFPALQRDFHATLAATQWVSLAYLLALVGLLAGAGRFADVLGRKLVYLYGFVVFTAASAACGLAPTLTLLIVFRVVQAVGAAMLQANSVALVVTSVPKARMRAALGVQAAAQALGLALGPTLGGLLVDSAGWRWVFWINVPVGIVAVVAGRFLLPRTRQRAPSGRFDWAGLALLATTTTALLLALSGAAGLPVPVLPTIMVAVLGGVGFWLRERRAVAPLVDLSLLRSRTISTGLIGAMCGYLVLFGPLVLVPQLLSSGAVHAGLVLTALPVGFAIAAIGGEHVGGMGRWTGPCGWGNRRRCGLGALIALLAVLLLIMDSPSSVPVLGLLGAGLGLFIPANNSAVMAAIPASLSATAGGMVSMARGIGTALGVCLVTLSLHLGGGATTALGFMAAAALIAALTAVTVGKRREQVHNGRHGSR